MENYIIKNSGCLFLKIMSWIVIVAGFVISVLFLAKGSDAAIDLELSYYIKAIMSLIFSLFMGAVGLNLANINQNHSFTRMIHENELREKGLSADKTDNYYDINAGKDNHNPKSGGKKPPYEEWKKDNPNKTIKDYYSENF